MQSVDPVEKEKARLEALRSYTIIGADADAALNRITTQIARLLHVPIALVTLVEEDSQDVKSTFGISFSQCAREDSFCTHTIESHLPMVVPDTIQDPRFRQNRFVTGAAGFRFYAGAPLRTAAGHNLGALCVLDTQPRVLTEAELTLLTDLAAMVVDELELRKTLRSLQSEVEARAKIQCELETTLHQLRQENQDRMDAEARLREQTRQLARSHDDLAATMRENFAYSVAIRSSVVGLLITDATQPDNPTILINPAFERITGYTAAEVIGKNCRFLQGPDSSPEQIEAMREAIREGKTFRGLIRNYRKDGTPFWNELVVDPAFDEEGRLIHFVGLQNDVTPQVEAELALRASEARKAAILEASLDSVITIDHLGRVLEINRATTSIFGYEPAEMLGRTMAELIVPPSMRAMHTRGMAHFMKTGEGPALGQRLELPAMRKGGAEFPIELTISRIHGEGLPTFTGHIRDITARKQNEEALRLAKEEAERANAAKSDFLSRMSHELRTPLNAIIGFSQLLQRRALEPRNAESVGYIAKAGHHLLGLVNEVLDLARIEAGHTSWSPEAVSVAEVLAESVDLVRTQAAERSVQVLVDPQVAAAGICVTADRQRLKQIFLNLLTNAVKYNREGGCVTVRARAISAQSTALEFADTGVGLSLEQLGKLFIPFERLNAEQNGVEGTGIGLAITRRLAVLMGGSVEVESKVGQGSLFRVTLPAAERPAPLPAAAASQNHPAGAEAGAVTVLYVEDHSINQRLMEQVASEYGGIRLILCSLGKEAVPLALRHAPALILLDLHLPDLPGEQVLQRLRAEPRLQGTPILIVSADARTTQTARLLEQGATDYLTKPIEVAGMLKKFEEFLGVPA